MPEHGDCTHFIESAYCGATAIGTYQGGPRCAPHTPAALAGRPEANPDPALTMDGLRERATAAAR